MKRPQYTIIGIVITVLVLLGLVYFFFFRPTSTITLINLMPDVEVYVDNVKSNVTSENPDFRVRKGDRSVIVAKEGYYPWFKELHVTPHEDIILEPFLFSRSLRAETVPATSTDAVSIRQSIVTSTLPTEENMKVSESGNVGLYVVDDKNLLAKWLGDPEEGQIPFCSEGTCDPVLVINSGLPITGVEFYKDRDSVVLFSTVDTIFAIEIKRYDPQNLQPIFQGNRVRFVKAPGENVLYILDQDIVRTLTLE